MASVVIWMKIERSFLGMLSMNGVCFGCDVASVVMLCFSWRPGFVTWVASSFCWRRWFIQNFYRSDHRMKLKALQNGNNSVNNVQTGFPVCNAFSNRVIFLRGSGGGGGGGDHKMMMMSWCLMSSDVIWHIRNKLWPMPKHGSIKSTYVRCMRV